MAAVTAGLLAWVAGLTTGAGAAWAIDAEWVMYQDPRLPAPTVEVQFPPGLAELWSEALESPVREMRRRAAAAILRAQSLGMTGLEVTVPALAQLAESAGQDSVLRATAVRALVALDARQTIVALSESLDGRDLSLAEVLEPALADWKDASMADVWRARLQDTAGLHRLRVLAIRGLTALEDASVLPQLRELVLDHRTPMPIRWEAALALGRLQHEGLEDTAQSLSRDRSPAGLHDRLLATAMLGSHRSDSAQALLTELAVDPATVVRALALEYLYRITPDLILPLIDQTITSPDVKVRQWAAETLAARPTPERIHVLARLLDDVDPELRRAVCDKLLAIARQESDEAFHSAVIDAAREQLAADSWRGQEQATLLLVTLDDKAAVDRLLELLDAERIEVHVTAAWGLSHLAVPSTCEQILKVYTDQTNRRLANEELRPGMFMQLSHLAQALGEMNYAPADEQLRKLVPKDFRFAQETRAASIWALGRLHAGVPDEGLAHQLVERLKDIYGMQPELPLVRRLSAVSLGRMRAESCLEDLRRMGAPHAIQSDVGMACAWAVHEITGDPIPPIPPLVQWEVDWFLQPLRTSSAVEH